MRINYFWPNFLACIVSSQAYADPSPRYLSLREAIDHAREFSPGLKAAHSRESQARSNVKIAESSYYPIVEAQAIDSTGFPGSTSSLGAGGLMGSPYRSGLGAGVVFTQTLYDFGRNYSSVKTNEFAAERQEQDTQITRYQIDQEVMDAYFNCTLNQAQVDIWKSLERDASVVSREVNHFVSTGQRSIVDRYLAQTQLEEARTAIADYETREAISIKRLSVLMGTPADFLCPPISTLGEHSGLSSSNGPNPFIARAEADLRSAQAEHDQARSDHLPVIVGMGSAGYLQDTRLVGASNYSLGIGVSIPLFEGFKVSENVNRTAALAEEKDFALAANRQFLDDYNQKYDQTILSSEIRLDHLRDELTLANDAFDLAKKRYFAFEGDLLDVRTALANLTRVLLDTNTTRAQYLQFKGYKEALNGAQ